MAFAGQRSGGEPQVQLLFFRHHGQDIGRALGRAGPPGFGAFQRLVQPAAAGFELDEDLADRALVLDAANHKLFEFRGCGQFGP